MAVLGSREHFCGNDFVLWKQKVRRMVFAPFDGFIYNDLHGVLYLVWVYNVLYGFLLFCSDLCTIFWMRKVRCGEVFQALRLRKSLE